MPERFPSPFEVKTPAGAEGWERMYNWYHLFGAERQELDEQRFWFQDRLHHPGVLHPYDEIQCECWWQALGAFNTRIFSMPPAFGVDQRILNGRLYVTPVPAPPEEIAARATEFGRRAGHYYENWDAIYASGRPRSSPSSTRSRRSGSHRCPTLSPSRRSSITSGTPPGIRMIRTSIASSSRCTRRTSTTSSCSTSATPRTSRSSSSARPRSPTSPTSRSRAWSAASTSISTAPTTSSSGWPRRRSGSGSRARSSTRTRPTELFAALEETAAGAEWLGDWSRTADPWFLINTDPGHPAATTTTTPGWTTRTSRWRRCSEYLRRLQAGETIDRPTRRGAARAGPDRGRVPRAARRGRPAGVRRDARAGPDGVRLHRGARALHRALDVGDVLGQVQGAVAARWPRWARSTSRRTCSSCAATRSRRRSTTAWPDGRWAAPPAGAAYWRPIVTERRRIFDGAGGGGAAARPRPATGGGQRAVHRHALGDHDLHRQRVAEPGGRRR